MADEIGITPPGPPAPTPLPPLIPALPGGEGVTRAPTPAPKPPITRAPRPRDSVVVRPGVPTPAPTPAPPLEPELPPSGGSGGGFPDLLDLAALLLVLGILALLFYMTGLVNFVMKLVWSAFGRGGSAPQFDQTQVGQPVSSLLAPYVVSRDAQFGANFSQMAATASRVGRAILAVEEALGTAIDHFLPLEGQITSANTQAAHLSGRVSRQEAAQDAASRQAALSQTQARQRAQSLTDRLAAVELGLGAVVETQRELVRHAVPELQRGQAVANDQLRQHNHALGADGLALGVAAALGTLNAGWTRCDNNGQLGRANCGLPGNLLKDLLSALSVVALGTFTLVELAKWELTVIEEVKTVVADFWAVNLPG